jgi:DNA-binding transcriptional LysR family regulator
MGAMHVAWGTLTPSWVTTLLAVGEHLNYTRAAEALHLTQPAVSRQMQALQRAVGLPLVEQLGRSLALTDAGRALLREAARLRGDLARAGEVMDELRGGGVGRLRIGASTAPGLYLLPRALGRFLADRPRIELSFRLANTLEVEEALLGNELDLGFVGGHLASADLAVEPLVEDEVLVYAARGHPLARARRVDPRRLVQEPFIMREPGSATRRSFETWLAGRGLRLERVIELACPEAGKRLVEAGLGLALSSCHGLPARGGPFKVLRVPGLDIRRELLVARHRDKVPSPLAVDLVRAVRRQARRCAHDGTAHG